MKSYGFILCWFVMNFGSTCSAAKEYDWKSVLKTNLQGIVSARPMGAFCTFFSGAGCTFVNVSPEVAKILEGHSREELLSELFYLRKYNANVIQVYVVDFWIRIVSEKVHGEPSTVQEGTGLQAKQFPIVAYSLRDIPHD